MADPDYLVLDQDMLLQMPAADNILGVHSERLALGLVYAAVCHLCPSDLHRQEVCTVTLQLLLHCVGCPVFYVREVANMTSLCKTERNF